MSALKINDSSFSYNHQVTDLLIFNKMIDLDLLRNNLEKVKSNLSNRAFEFDTALWNELEEKRKTFQVQMEKFQAEQNKIAKEIGFSEKNSESTENLKEKSSEISNQLKQIKRKFN